MKKAHYKEVGEVDIGDRTFICLSQKLLSDNRLLVSLKIVVYEQDALDVSLGLARLGHEYKRLKLGTGQLSFIIEVRVVQDPNWIKKFAFDLQSAIDAANERLAPTLALLQF